MRRLYVKVVLALVLVLFSTGTLGAADVVHPHQYIVWEGASNAVAGTEFPEGTQVTYIVRVHSDADTNAWQILDANALHEGAMVEHLYLFNVPLDGYAYQASIIPFIIWPDGEEQFGDECRNVWVRARRPVCGGCSWRRR